MKETGAPSGSLYHFFPGGKDDLSVEIVLAIRKRYDALIKKTLAERTHPADAMAFLFKSAASALEELDFADGCPIGNDRP